VFVTVVQKRALMLYYYVSILARPPCVHFSEAYLYGDIVLVSDVNCSDSAPLFEDLFGEPELVDDKGSLVFVNLIVYIVFGAVTGFICLYQIFMLVWRHRHRCAFVFEPRVATLQNH